MEHAEMEKGIHPMINTSGSVSELGTPGTDPEKDAGRTTPTSPQARSVDGDHSSEADSSDAEHVDPATAAPQGIIGRVLSRVSAHSVEPGPPPDGGRAAWMAVLCLHLIVMNSWGLINSFGVFQTYYVDLFSLPPSTISWIGSIQVFLLFFIGTFTGRLTDAGYFRLVLLTGSFLQLLGIFSASFASSYVHLLLAQGICMGLANGFIFCPSIATISTYFTTKRAIALGIGACGSATGGIIFPLISRFLIPQVGLPWTLRTIGFVQLVALVFCNFFLRPRIPPRSSGPLVEWAAFRSAEYSCYAAGSFFLFLGVYFPFYYLASFATSQVRPVFAYEKSLDLLLVLNAIGCPGRLIPNYFADRFGVLTLMIPVSFSTVVLMYSWIGVTTQPGLRAWSAIYGFAGGAIQGLFPAGASTLTDDPRKQGTRIGMIFTIVSFATLTGPPICGAIIEAMGGRYVGAQVFSASCCVVGLTFITFAGISKAKRTPGGWKAKV
ncbi:related to monocarboxylate transporter 4 [Cephalotrichum gorgonifer]|uniref:Related to monocarboxylate transporter 4 n=1 Tax=Cephalotrichum gorgonifer TaxID=2041049 RepID=A0AAE8SYK0_9PEZI|nr:related to monocarboxylate transporter 4 [Cephalotrichum gorgonifer]